MDKLAKEAALARLAGETYGQWKARQHDRDIKLGIVRHYARTVEIIPGNAVCPVCGEAFESKRGAKYCSDECRYEKKKQQMKEWYEENYKPKADKPCGVCGKPFKRKARSQLY